VDILTPDQAKRFPPVPIQRPPPEPFELRVILWRADKVKAMDEVRVLVTQAWCFACVCIACVLSCLLHTARPHRKVSIRGLLELLLSPVCLRPADHQDE
jgi:hypothetical protein